MQAVELLLEKAKYRALRGQLLSPMELEVLGDIREFLQSFHIVQEGLSAEKTPTLSVSIPLYEKLIVVLKLQREEYPKIAHGINASIRKLNKYIVIARGTRVYTLAMGKYHHQFLRFIKSLTNTCSHSSAV